MKTALCISGSIQDFEKCVFNINKIIQKYKCDVFIFLNNAIDDLLLHQVKYLYKPKKIVIQKDICCNNYSSDFNFIYQYFSNIQHCNDLRIAFEEENKIKYDIIIHTRFNINIIDQLNENEMTNMDALYVPLFNNNNGINPYIAFGSSELINIYSNTFSKIQNYISHKLPPNLEKVLLWSLNQEAVKVRLSNINHSIIENNQELNLSNQFNTRRKKVAICMSGLMRMGLENFNNFKKTFLLPYYDYDIFIDTWNVVQVPINHKSIPLSSFINTIKSTYNPVRFNIENVVNFKYSNLILQRNREKRSIQNLLSMCYKIQSCNSLKKQYELDNNFIYDSVVRIRSDMECISNINVIKDLYTLNIPDSSDYSGINDQFAYSNSKNMDLYSTWFNKIDQFLLLNDKVVFNMEVLSKINILKNKIPLNRFPCEYNLLRLDWTRQNNRTHAKLIGCSDIQSSNAWTEATGLGLEI